MTFKHFGLLLLTRLVALGLTSIAFVYAFNHPDYHAVTLLMFLTVLVLLHEFWLFLTKTNREVTRFLSAARYADFSQRFEFENVGGGFEDLGETFTDILEQMKKLRTAQEVKLKHLGAMVNHVPVPLLSIRSDDSVQLLNNAARRLFGVAQPTKLVELKQFGNEFYEAIKNCKVGENRLTVMSVDGFETKITLGLATISSNIGTERLISIQDIDKELVSIQLTAWQDLVRVLTHEIMNSLTPVASLAQTTSDMAEDVHQKMDDAHPQKRDLHKISDAASTVARRAGNLMTFVTNYRELARLPVPKKRGVKLQDIFDHVVRIAEADADDNSRAVKILYSVVPDDLTLYADRDQIEQALINLLRNAKQALANKENGLIELIARFNPRGKIVIEVSDNGPGIAEQIINKIFVPYFTTKAEGSGIGLALVRQVINSHGGVIKAENLGSGGAKFTLIL